MDRSLFAFIWRHSKRDQMILLGLTVLSFPFLYASLELPKRIINDAIGAVNSTVTIWGVQMTQVEYLVVLCVLFLAAVLSSGLFKMRINTYKGTVSERMLRRLRYQLMNRMMRFPAPYFRTTSQGELVSMITAEAEPMGGLMGDAVAQPVFQAGQMLTIVTFLFMQSIWFGLAGIALIPLQAWLIPMLQRQINLLNKDRIVEVRHLSSEIGETAAGISDLRANGGWRQRSALLTDRLGRIFEIRFKIYQKKFFMKFINNLITQLTPFFFYLVGGILAIQGQISVGALVAALAAYKDIAAPWKELLTYYNQVQDMSLRWDVVTERFAPRSMIDERLIDGVPDRIPRLDGDIALRDVSVMDQDGNTVLEDITLDIPSGSRVAIEGGTAAERAALAGLLTREILPSRGKVEIGGRDLSTLHQAVIAARVGYAHSQPYLFDGTLGQNLLMPFAMHPGAAHDPDWAKSRAGIEAMRSGNSPDPLLSDWLDPSIGGYADGDDIGSWWFKLIQAIGQDDEIFHGALQLKVSPEAYPELTRAIVGLRDAVHERIVDRGLDDIVFRFDPDAFNPAVPLGGNLLFAAPRTPMPSEGLAQARLFRDLLNSEGLGLEALNIGQSVIDTLHRTFGHDGIDHPLFRRVGLDPEIYVRLLDIVSRRRAGGNDALGDEDELLLMTVPFTLTAEQIGSDFPDRLKDKIVRVRKTHRDTLRDISGQLFVPVAPDAYLPRLTVLENALYGRVSIHAGARSDEVEAVVGEVLSDEGLRWRIARLIFDLQTGIGGANLPKTLQERAAFSRAALKRPDILIFDRVLESHDSEARAAARTNLRELLPKATMVFMERHFRNPGEYDMVVRLSDGRIDGARMPGADEDEGSEEFRHKLRAIAATELFSRLDARNQRLLAFSASWYRVKPGKVIFRAGQVADAVYLCMKGRAELRWPDAGPEDKPITVVEPGRVIGDLSIIERSNRVMDLVAVEPSRFLRIGAEEFRDVIEADATVAVALLETVAGHLSSLVGFLDSRGVDVKRIISEAEGDALDEITYDAEDA
ncbi:ABC transporter transmembrane domain-containing protein [Marinibacterium sp. SX1]|uniref:ABC transporter transmembrane domain-containing protein n=1 Tax=Marinibacterium sp. SX1 TaxID=3388424 RepID=UPI003D1853BB